MKTQKHLFQLPPDIHYLNGAYMSPLMKSVEEVGIDNMIKKRNPTCIQTNDFFETAKNVKDQFARLINGKSEQVAIIPSVSYGLMNAVQNVKTQGKTHALIVADEFPSSYYTLQSWCEKHRLTLKTIDCPVDLKNKGQAWNEQLIANINEKTAVVIVSSVHWTDGTKFLLKEIGAACKAHQATFIVDGTQSVGALPINIADDHIDVLVCAGYKWLLGPYSMGLAYYGDQFNDGVPVEQSWTARTNAEDFKNLTQYVDTYHPGAARFNVGEYSNFILLPMLQEALHQILNWGVGNIQTYCAQCAKPLKTFLEENDFGLEHPDYLAGHLFGFRLPKHITQDRLMKSLSDNKIYVSVRGSAVRVSVHVYNDPTDVDALINVLSTLRQ